MNFETFKDIQQKFQQLPNNFLTCKKYYTKKFEEIIKIKKYDKLNNKTINNHMINFKSFFNFLEYIEVIKENPLAKIKLLPEDQEIKKIEYSQEDLELIFNSNLEKEYKNMFKFGLYTGLRIEEVLSIKKMNVKDNLINVDLQDTSSKKHNRIIPIHQNLMRVINYQKRHNSGSFLFFGGLKDLNKVGKKINDRLHKIIKNPYKTFHSLRKNFSQEIELKTDAEEKTKKYLIGHSFKKDVTHTVYNRGKMNIEKLEDCINQITFMY